MQMKNITNYCPECWSQSFITHNYNKYHCSECDFSFYRNISCAVWVIIYNSEGKILLWTRKYEPYKGFLDIIWWFTDQNESIEETCRRECKEELWITIQDIQYIGSFPSKYIWSWLEIPIINCIFETTLNTEQIQSIQVWDDVDSISWYKKDSIRIEQLAQSVQAITTIR